MRFTLFFILVTTVIINGCKDNSKSQLNTSRVSLGSKMELQFRSWIISKPINKSELLGELHERFADDTSPVYTGLYGFSIGAPIGNYDRYEYRRINSNLYVHDFEINQYDHEIKALGENSLRALVITFYARPNIIPKYKCPYATTDTNPPQVINSIVKCLPLYEAFCKQEQESLHDTLDKLQSDVLYSFFDGNWLAKSDYNYFSTSPTYFVSYPSQYYDGYNAFSGNCCPVWISEKGLIITINFCTEHYGAEIPMQEDYFEDIEKYQTGKKKYPVMRCLITSLNEARKNNYIDLEKILWWDFVEINQPVSTVR